MKALILLNTNYHFEIVPSLVKYYNEKGYTVDIINNNNINKQRINMLNKCDIIYNLVKKPVTNNYNVGVLITFDPWMTIPKKYINFQELILVTHNYCNKFKDHEIIHKHRNIKLLFVSPAAFKSATEKYPDSYFLLPTVFPNYQFKINENEILVQGNITNKRRNYKCLIDIAKKCNNLNFYFKIVGRKADGTVDWLKKQIKQNNLNDKFKFVINPDYNNFFKEVSTSRYIMPCIDETYKHDYFKDKLTASITIGFGYKMDFIIHSDLAKIYDFKTEVGVHEYSSVKEIETLFPKLFQTNHI